MRSVVFILFASVLAIFSACGASSVDSDVNFESQPAAPLPDDRQPVLVELFTSEGCSSCPPADRNLAFLEKQQPVTKANIITLAFHVDYWDRLGWKDRFSSPLYSRRQEIYSQAFKLGSNYTPQMVVDGGSEFVGSDSGKAANAILKATETEKAVVESAFVDGRLTARISNAPRHADATIYAAIAEDGISTRVERGENSGKTLEHVSVVRDLKTLGMLAADKTEFDGAVDVQLPMDAKAENLKVVVFIQENESRRIVGVARSPWKKN